MRWHEIIDLDEAEGGNQWGLFDPRVAVMAKARIESEKANKKLKRSKSINKNDENQRVNVIFLDLLMCLW